MARAHSADGRHTFAAHTPARVLMFGEGALVGAGLHGWPGGAARCAREFLSAGPHLVRHLDAATAARGGYSILEAASIAMGDEGAVGPPFRTYLFGSALVEQRPPPPCR